MGMKRGEGEGVRKEMAKSTVTKGLSCKTVQNRPQTPKISTELRQESTKPAQPLPPLEPDRLLRRSSKGMDTERMNPANQRTVRSFLDYLKVEKGLAELSVRAYESDLVQFADFLEARRRELVAARREDVRAFLNQLFANSVGDRSVARKLSALRQFFRYLLLDRVMKHDPT